MALQCTASRSTVSRAAVSQSPAGQSFGGGSPESRHLGGGLPGGGNPASKIPGGFSSLTIQISRNFLRRAAAHQLLPLVGVFVAQLEVHAVCSARKLFNVCTSSSVNTRYSYSRGPRRVLTELIERNVCCGVVKCVALILDHY